MASRMKVDVVEVVGNKKEFEYELDMKVKELTRSEIINISIAVSETNTGHEIYSSYTSTVTDDAWWK